MRKITLFLAITISACSQSSNTDLGLEALQAPNPYSNIADWDGADKLIKISGFKPKSQTIEIDDDCKIKRLKFQDDLKPAATLEFKCKYINIYWTQYKEIEFSEANAEALNKARVFSEILTGTSDFVNRAAGGEIFRKGVLAPTGYMINGSCVGNGESCLLALTPQIQKSY